MKTLLLLMLFILTAQPVAAGGPLVIVEPSVTITVPTPPAVEVTSQPRIPGYLGVIDRPSTLFAGVMNVQSVASNSPAKMMGFEQGDIIFGAEMDGRFIMASKLQMYLDAGMKANIMVWKARLSRIMIYPMTFADYWEINWGNYLDSANAL